jgi:hypothetical protein
MRTRMITIPKSFREVRSEHRFHDILAACYGRDIRRFRTDQAGGFELLQERKMPACPLVALCQYVYF